MRTDDAAVREALLLGARGYVLKDTDGSDFIRAVTSVARGDTHLDRDVAEHLTALLHSRTTAAPFPGLTERERAVLTLMAQGRSNGEIGREMYLSTKTVQNYVSRVFGKIGVADRAQAIVAAREKGLHLTWSRVSETAKTAPASWLGPRQSRHAFGQRTWKSGLAVSGHAGEYDCA
jgi:DNA-binding NarL/FixJ family response regulator